VLAVDTGTKRVGLALSDPTGTVAMPLRTLDAEPAATLAERLAAVAAEVEAGALIVGLPRRMEGGEGPEARSARALATRPKLLLLDEVMAGLHPTDIDAMCDFLLHLRERGVSTVGAIEHLLRVVMKISQRTIALDLGSKIAEGTPEEIMRNAAVIAAYFGTAIGA